MLNARPSRNFSYRWPLGASSFQPKAEAVERRPVSDRTEVRASDSNLNPPPSRRLVRLAMRAMGLRRPGRGFGRLCAAVGRCDLGLTRSSVPHGAGLVSGKPVLAATGTRGFAGTGTVRVRRNLLGESKQLLKHSNHRKLPARGVSARSDASALGAGGAELAIVAMSPSPCSVQEGR